jgi:NAD(P)H-dependent flavin oxidoreductase YrpB (nitropropane dioxygenase family)
MSLDELRDAIKETSGRTDAPFGVNLRADAPDAAERVGLIIAGRVASFAQAPKPELIAALKDAGVITIASVGAGWLRGPRRAAGLIRSARNAAAFRGVSGLSWPELIRQGRAMHRDTELTWGQVLMAANTPVLLRAAMVDGRADLGLMSSGQVAGLIDDLPSCQELIEAIMAEAERCLGRLAAVRKA